MRRILASEWTAAAIAFVVLAFHVVWFLRSDHQGDVLTGLGAATTTLGIYVAAQPYIRKGLKTSAREQVGLHVPEHEQPEPRTNEEEVELEGVRHVIKERVVGVILIAAGSLLNGYGIPIARWLALKGP